MSDESLSVMEGSDPDAPSLPTREKRRNRWLLITVLTVLAAVLLAGTGVTLWYGKSALDGLNNIGRENGLLPTGQRPDPVVPASGAAPLNFLIIGADARGDERGRSDVLQLLHVSGDRSNAFLMSVPRDSYVEIPGRGKAKINAAYSWGGAPLAVATMEQLLDVPIDDVIIIDFEGFVSVIDALGGITVINREASSSNGIDFPEGELTLTGSEALVFVRERKTLSNGDFGRAERQRDVIKAVVGKLASGGVLADPVRFREAVIQLGSNMTVSDGLTNDEIIRLGWEMRGITPSSIKSFQLPTAGFGTTADKQSIVVVDEAKVDQLKTALRGDTMLAFYEAQK